MLVRAPLFNQTNNDDGLFSHVGNIIKTKIIKLYFFYCTHDCVFNSITVTGPEFQHIRIGVGHRLDVSSSGVLGIIISKWVTVYSHCACNDPHFFIFIFWDEISSSRCRECKQDSEQRSHNSSDEGKQS